MTSNISQSVRDRLLHHTRETGEDHQVVLTRFALERLLYRLTQLPEGKKFALKGAFTFLVWEGELTRQTRDLDLLGSGSPDEARIKEVVTRACQVDVPEDGVQFDTDSIQVAPIREEAEYEGLRVKLTAHIGSARLSLQVDVGFGDVVTPSPEQKVFPGLLDFPEPKVKTYPPETVVSEKLHGIVRFGRANTRMKDFYDIWRISHLVRFEGKTLVHALRATFDRRETPLPQELPVALTEAFAGEPGKERQWRAFIQQVEHLDLDLQDMLDGLQTFLLPVLRATREGVEPPRTWPPGGPWVTE